MIKQIAWNIFKQTGNINTFLELKEVANMEQNLRDVKRVETHEISENKGNNNCRK